MDEIRKIEKRSVILSLQGDSLARTYASTAEAVRFALRPHRGALGR
jgi:hypothetical protein